MKTLLSLLLLIAGTQAYAQNIGINPDGGAPNPSALLDVDANALPVNDKKGLLIPRLALTATNVPAPVVAPATSLLVYNTATAGTVPTNVTPGYYYWDGVQWVRLLATTDPPPAPTCPPGFARVPGRNYCIEVNERTLTDWNNANTTCLGLGYRLCGPDEWRDACNFRLLTQDNLGSVVPLQSMDDNEEWTNDFASGIDVVVLGSGSCTYTNQVSISAASPRFRCCYTR